MQLVSRADGTAPPSCRPVAPLSSSLLFFVFLSSRPRLFVLAAPPAPDVSRFAATFVSPLAVFLGRQQDGALEWRLVWVFVVIRRFLRFTSRAGLLERPRKEGRTDARD